MLLKFRNTWALAHYCILPVGCDVQIDVKAKKLASRGWKEKPLCSCMEMSLLNRVVHIQWQRISLISLVCDLEVYENVLYSSYERGFIELSPCFLRQACGNLGWRVKGVHKYSYHCSWWSYTVLLLCDFVLLNIYYVHSQHKQWGTQMCPSLLQDFLVRSLAIKTQCNWL